MMLKDIRKFSLSVAGVLLFVTQTQAAIPNNSHPTTSFGPSIQPGYTGVIDATTAFNVAAEAGVNNYRVGATLGYQSVANRRFKITAEYITQNLSYPYFSGNYSQWDSQISVGADYQYDLPINFMNPQLDIIGYYAHAANQNAGIETGSYINNVGTAIAFMNNRHVAGSNDWGLSPGVSVKPWAGARAGVLVNYDFAHYSKIFAPQIRVTGFGGTATFTQVLMKNIEVGASAGFRQPFNDYQASVVWSNVPDSGKWAVGLDGDYTAGKHSLPSSYNVGLSLNYFFDQRVQPVPETNKDKTTPAKPQQTMPVNDGLLAYTSKPAVHLPEVLSVADEAVS